MSENDLGYLKNYGHIIIPIFLVLYAALVAYLSREYK